MAFEHNSAQNRAAEAGTSSSPHPLLEMAGQAHRASTDWMNANLRSQWDRNLRAVQSRHPAGSKYFSGDYAHRSKLFRPKTRASVRAMDAAVAAAFFSTEGVASVSASNDADPIQLASARVNQALLQYRLTRTIPWYLTVVGAGQDAQVYGYVVSRQAWVVEEIEDGVEDVQTLDPVTGEPMFDPLTGEPIMGQVPRWRTIKDEPSIIIMPPENVRIDPGADWTNPTQSSPYLIVDLPMFVCDVKAKMRQPEGKTGATPWHTVGDGILQQARDNTPDPTRQAREQGKTTTTTEARTGVSDFDIVWVRENFLRVDGADQHFMSLTDVALLTDPVPARQVYQQDERPYVMGFGQVETHKAHPASKVEMLQELQSAANEVANQRMDNVKLAINGRFYVRAGRGVDVAALKKSVPGGVVYMREPNTDVKSERPADVTSSAYQEQDRLNNDFDELAGSFSPSSVQSNRQLNETVGGMQILAGQASGMVEFDLRTFSETWAEPVLRQVVRLEQRFETDAVILALAGQTAEIIPRFGIDTITDDLMLQDVLVRVNVGIGATDPMRKLQKFDMAMKTIAGLLGEQAVKRLNVEEVIAEVFGAAGYKDGKRFFMLGDDPKYQQLTEALEEMKGVIETLQDKQAQQLEIEKLRLGARSQDQQTQLAAEAEGQQLDLKGKAVLAQQDQAFEIKKIIAEAMIEQKQEMSREMAPLREAAMSRFMPASPSVVIDSKGKGIEGVGQLLQHTSQLGEIMTEFMAVMAQQAGEQRQQIADVLAALNRPKRKTIVGQSPTSGKRFNAVVLEE